MPSRPAWSVRWNNLMGAASQDRRPGCCGNSAPWRRADSGMCGRWGRVMSACSVEVERGPDRLRERGFLFCQKEAQLAPERTHGHRDDVVAADNAVVIEPVGWAHRNLRGQAAHGAGDGRDGDPAEVGAHDLTGEAV